MQSASLCSSVFFRARRILITKLRESDSNRLLAHREYSLEQYLFSISKAQAVVKAMPIASTEELNREAMTMEVARLIHAFSPSRIT
jgi:hypothetical protein